MCQLAGSSCLEFFARSKNINITSRNFSVASFTSGGVFLPLYDMQYASIYGSIPVASRTSSIALIDGAQRLLSVLHQMWCDIPISCDIRSDVQPTVSRINLRADPI
jgi:hypothetical protein